MPSLRTHHLMILWAGASFGVVATVIYPQTKAISSLDRQLHELVKMMDETDAVIEQTEVLSDWVVKIRSTVELSTRPIPQESDVSGFVRDLSLQMAEIGVERREIVTSSTAETEHAMVLPITISMTTSFPQIVEVIGWVENLPRLVRLRRVKISANRSAYADTDHVLAEIVLDAYFEPEEYDPMQNLFELITTRLGEE